MVSRHGEPALAECHDGVYTHLLPATASPPAIEEGSMPHTRSAKKNLRKTEKRRQANRAVKRELKTYCKRVDAAVTEGNVEKMKAELILAIKKLDKAAAKKVIHPNMAARKKSQLARLVNVKAAAKPATPPPEQK